jgi:hypothetical protein
MKKIITILLLAFSLSALSQTSIGDVLNDLQWDLRLGCCSTDDDNHSDFPECIYSEYQNYYTNGDVNINDNHLRLSNTTLTVNGDFYALNTESQVTFSNNCTSELIIMGNLIITSGAVDTEAEGLIVYGDIITDASLSVLEHSKSLKTDEPYIIYDLLGKVVKKGLYRSKEDLFSKEPMIILFPKLNLSFKTVIDASN